MCVIGVTQGNLQGWDENGMHEILAKTFFFFLVEDYSQIEILGQTVKFPLGEML